jgi:hypothetical protein
MQEEEEGGRLHVHVQVVRFSYNYDIRKYGTLGCHSESIFSADPILATAALAVADSGLNHFGVCTVDATVAGWCCKMEKNIMFGKGSQFEFKTRLPCQSWSFFPPFHGG